jgi:nucleotide-binding universal stress UspA family protein
MDNMKKILIAIDDGPTSEKVATIGFQLGQQINAEIALVSVADTSVLMTDGGVTPREMTDITKNDLKNNQQMLLDKVFKNYKVWTFVEEGNPFEAILKVAEEWEADLIVLGTHGRTGLSHLLMGSIAEKVIRHSTKPLFIVPTKS